MGLILAVKDREQRPYMRADSDEREHVIKKDRLRSNEGVRCALLYRVQIRVSG
jgi:hypothetical protein